MREALFTVALLFSALTLPLTAHADTIDDFVLTGQGHTITYSLPATSAAYPNHIHFNSFSESAPTTIDGVSGYVETGQYFLPVGFTPTLELSVPAVFGEPALLLTGLTFFSIASEPASNPPPDFQEDLIFTFIPGNHSLQSVAFEPGLPPFDPPVYYPLTITPETAPSTVPEPSTLVLLSTGTLGLISFATSRRKSDHHSFN